MDFVVRAFLYFKALWSYDKYQFAEVWKEVKFTGKRFACIIFRIYMLRTNHIASWNFAAIFNFDLLRFIEEISINIISIEKNIENLLLYTLNRQLTNSYSFTIHLLSLNENKWCWIYCFDWTHMIDYFTEYLFLVQDNDVDSGKKSLKQFVCIYSLQRMDKITKQKQGIFATRSFIIFFLLLLAFHD